MLLGARRLRRQGRLDRSDTELLMRMTRSGERMARMLDQLVDYVRVRVEDEIPLQRRFVAGSALPSCPWRTADKPSLPICCRTSSSRSAVGARRGALPAWVCF
jgi:hypothetical protein